jgi:hypothetical protein
MAIQNVLHIPQTRMLGRSSKPRPPVLPATGFFFGERGADMAENGRFWLNADINAYARELARQRP